MIHMWRRYLAWFYAVRERYIARFILVTIITITSVYSVVFFLLMRVFEGKTVSVWDSLYWTINRLSTTGELPEELFYSAAPIQALSMLVQISGLAFVFSAFPLILLPAIERRIRGVTEVVQPDLEDHIVVCGYSPLVASLLDELAAGTRAFVVIHNELDVVRRLQQKRIQALFAPSIDEEILTLAGAQNAKYVIANMEDEEENAKLVLTAAALTGAEIFALIDDLDHAHYFRYAGAAQVLSPKRLLGTHLAHKAAAAWRDELFGASEVVPGHFVIELPVYPGSPFDGMCLRDARIPQRSGAYLIGIWHKGKLEVEPGPDSCLSVENVLVAVGDRDQLVELQKLTRTIEVEDISVERHFVIAGFGDVGRAVKEFLDAQNIPSTMIDPRRKQGNYIQADATDEAALQRADIDRASTFIVASHVDRDNIFSALVARKLNPDLHILARANLKATTDNLYRAGADFVFSLSIVAGQMLAEMIVGDDIITLAEGLKMLTLPVKNKLSSTTIGQARIRSRTGCTVVACALPGGEFTPNPRAEFTFREGMSLVILGNTNQIKEFKKRFSYQ